MVLRVPRIQQPASSNQAGIFYGAMEVTVKHTLRHYWGLYRLYRINNTRTGAVLCMLRKPSF